MLGIVDRCDKRPDQAGFTGAPLLHGGAQIGPQTGFHIVSGIGSHIRIVSPPALNQIMLYCPI